MCDFQLVTVMLTSSHHGWLNSLFNSPFNSLFNSPFNSLFNFSLSYTYNSLIEPGVWGVSLQ